MGTERSLHHVRGGATGYNHPTSDTRRFAHSIANAADRVINRHAVNKNWIRSDSRDAADIHHI